MEQKKKRSEHDPIKLRTYFDGCTFILLMFVAFWGILIVGMFTAFDFMFHYGLTACAGSVILAAIILRLDRHTHQQPN